MMNKQQKVLSSFEKDTGQFDHFPPKMELADKCNLTLDCVHAKMYLSHFHSRQAGWLLAGCP
jgi:hypothetical protein